MARKRKIKPNKNFRKETRRQENLLSLGLGIAAVILAVVVVMSSKIDFASCSNTGAAVSDEEPADTEDISDDIVGE